MLKTYPKPNKSINKYHNIPYNICLSSSIYYKTINMSITSIKTSYIFITKKYKKVIFQHKKRNKIS